MIRVTKLVHHFFWCATAINVEFQRNVPYCNNFESGLESSNASERLETHTSFATLLKATKRFENEASNKMTRKQNCDALCFKKVREIRSQI